jgi:hypothetical protein
MKRIALFLTLAAVLLLAGRALAMSSEHYRLDWFVPLTGGGGGPAGSTHYAVNFTIGQSAVGTSSNTYRACLGYWCGIAEAAAVSYRIYLPLVMRND